MKYDTSEDCVRKKKKTPEARTPKVNLDHPKQEATWRQIQLFVNMTLRKITRASRRKLPNLELSKKISVV
jgi:hypothetical protein